MHTHSNTCIVNVLVYMSKSINVLICAYGQCQVHTLTNGGVAWLIKRWFELELGFLCLDYKPQQITLTWNSFFDNICGSLGSASQQLLLALIVPWIPLWSNWTNCPSWSKQTVRLVRLLDSNSNCLLWAGLRPTLELPLHCWTASHCCCSSYWSLELFLNVLLNPFLLSCALRGLAYSVLGRTAKKLPIVALAKLIVDSLLLYRESATSLVSADTCLCLFNSKFVKIYMHTEIHVQIYFTAYNHM
jgi:hypothetical protein